MRSWWGGQHQVSFFFVRVDGGVFFFFNGGRSGVTTAIGSLAFLLAL